MHARKEKKIINEVDLVKYNQNLPETVIVGIRSLSSKKWDISKETEISPYI